MNPKISVIVSTYNRRKTLERAIKSILKQTFEDYEIVIVDDVSTDDTEKYCRKLEQKYPDKIRFFKLPEHWGKHGKPKNVGIKEARGEFIAFLDDDNEYLVDHLQVLWNENVRNPQFQVIYGDRWLVDEHNKKLKKKGIAFDFDINRLRVQNYIDTSDYIVRKKDLLKIAGWDEYLPKFADWNLNVRMAKAGFNFFHVNKLITNYYVHEGMNQNKTKTPINPQNGLPMPTFEVDTCFMWARQETFGKETMPRVAIFTLTYDRLEYTKQMVESLKQFAGYEYDHFIVDNGSSDGTVTWLTENKDQFKKVIFNVNNYGISKASNQALNAIGQDYDIIIKLDNDCLLETENIIKEIAEIYRMNRRLVISPNVEGLIDNAGGMPRFKSGYIGPNLFGFVEHLGGIFVAAPKEVYEKFRWEEKDFLHGMQDAIFSKHCLNNGYSLAYYENHRVMHNESTAGQKKHFPEYFERRKSEKIKRYE